MIVYEVNLQIDSQVADDYAAWLKPHIEHILQIKGFRHADWYVCDSSDDKVHLTIHQSRRDKENREYHNFVTLWIVTKIKGKWGIQFRSSFLEGVSQINPLQ